MSHVTETPPLEIQADLDGLDSALDESIPKRTLDDNLLIATWNIKSFGGLTEAWVADPDDSPKRDLHSIRVIAEILRRFDVIAVQEVYGNLKALRHTLKALGDDWGLVLTDATRGHKGRNERLGFIFDRRKIQMSGLAGEVVVPEDWIDRVEPLDADSMRDQFARTPYAVSFRCGEQTFILVTLHVLYGDSVHERTPELRAIARWLDDWARDINSWDHNLIALGDFNIDRRGDPRYEAFTSTGLTVPDALHEVPRTITADDDEPHTEKFYDQIAWFTEDGDRPALSLSYRTAGHFDFRSVALPRRDLDLEGLGWRISDHYPLWTEFEL